jgi:hypothetical protein
VLCGVVVTSVSSLEFESVPMLSVPVVEPDAEAPDIDTDSSSGSVSPSPKFDGRQTASSWQCRPSSHTPPKPQRQNSVPGSQSCGMQ